MVTSDVRPEEEIWPFHACAMKNVQYNPYLWPYCQNCDARFKSGSGNMAVLCMRKASGHNYRNSSFIVDVAMGQIPCSTERISSYNIK